MPQVLAAGCEEVWLEPAHTWCDVVKLKSAGAEPAMDSFRLDELVSLYRGPLLDGFHLPGCPEFEYWCVVERTTLEQQYLRILENLVRRCTRGGQIRWAIRYAEQYLAADPLSEPMHRRLIQLHAAAGDRHLALRQFADCSSTLQADLGVSPLPETRAVYQAVLHGQPRSLEPPSLEAPSPVPLLPPLGGTLPMLGREEELGTLDMAFQGLQAQQGQVVLISGEAGIGKSRLMHEFCERHQGEARLLYGCGHAGGQAIPYQPILGVLRTILGLEEMGVGQQDSRIPAGRPAPGFIEPIWLAEVSRLLPELRSIWPDLPLPLPLEPETARTRLFDALCHLVLAYANARGPVLLCLDEVQWMDATTKAWLVHTGCYLAHRDHPILILGTCRSEEAEELADVRLTLARAGVLTELKLAGLEEAAVTELLRHLVGPRSGDKVLATRLQQATGGNPFYLIETVHKLIEEGRVGQQLQDAMQFPLPESIREAVQARLQRLSPIARQALEAGAVLGPSFDAELLRYTAGRGDNEIISALEELVARNLLVEASHQYRFIHDIMRQHVEESLGQVRRQLLHHRAAKAYQRFQPDAYPALAYHFELGGDEQKGLHYHELSARQACALFAWQMAEFHQGHMLKLLAQTDPGCDHTELVRKRADVLAERAHARSLQGRRAERDADLEALSALGEAGNDDRVRLQALLSRLRYLNLDGEYAQAIVVAKKGLALLHSSPMGSQDTEPIHVARSRLLAQLGLAYDSLGKPAEALDVLEQAWSLCREKADPVAWGRILHVLGYVHLHLGHYAQALDYQRQAYACDAEAGDGDRMVWDLVDISAVHKYLGDLAQAQRFLAEGLELARRVGSQQAQAYGLAHRGSLDLYQGDYAAAAAHYQQAVALQPATHSEHSLATAEAGAGLALYHLGCYSQSRHWLERSLARARASGHRRCAAETLTELGMLDTAEGRLSLARQHLEEGLAIAQDCRAGDCLAAGLAAKARLERLAGDPCAALSSAARAVSTSRQFSLTCCEMWSEFEAGLALLALGDPAAALEHTGRAANLAAEAGQDWIGSEEAYQAHARVLRALGQGEAADRYERCTRQAVQAKADLISDPSQRSHFLNRSHQS
jgi:tetratricopeptide (TPR) repeat protein